MDNTVEITHNSGLLLDTEYNNTVCEPYGSQGDNEKPLREFGISRSCSPGAQLIHFSP